MHRRGPEAGCPHICDFHGSGVNSSFMSVSIEHFFQFQRSFPGHYRRTGTCSPVWRIKWIRITPQRFISRATACIHTGSTGCPGRQTPAGSPCPIRSGKAFVKRTGRAGLTSFVLVYYEPIFGSDKSACPLFRLLRMMRSSSRMTGSSEGGSAVSSVIMVLP